VRMAPLSFILSEFTARERDIPRLQIRRQETCVLTGRLGLPRQ
jgi:hypothetical protein